MGPVISQMIRLIYKKQLKLGLQETQKILKILEVLLGEMAETLQGSIIHLGILFLYFRKIYCTELLFTEY